MLWILSDVGDIKYPESASEIFIEIVTLKFIFRNKSIFTNVNFYKKEFLGAPKLLSPLSGLFRLRSGFSQFVNSSPCGSLC